MNKDIFDYFDETEPLKGQDGFEKFAMRSPDLKDDSWIGTLKDYGKTALKGTAEGLQQLGHIMGPTGTPYEQQKSVEQLTDVLNEQLPTEEGFGQKAIRRGLKSLPSNLMIPGLGAAQTAGRTIAGGVLGQSAEELGAPEWAQSAAEITAFLGPDLSKKLLESGKDGELIKAAKKLGMSDEEIAPLINSKFKTKWLSKITSKAEGGRVSEAIKNTHAALKRSYENVTKSDVAKGVLDEQKAQKLVSSIDKHLKSVPSQVAETISKDYAQLLNEPLTGESLMNFWGKLNKYHNVDKGSLLGIKQFVGDAIKGISPELRDQFKTVNELYKKYYPLAKSLKPKLSDEIIDISTGIPGFMGAKVLQSILHADLSSLIPLVGAKVSKELASEFVINPRLQNMMGQFVKQANNSKWQIAKHTLQKMSSELDKSGFPEAADMIYELSKEGFDEIFGVDED